MEPKPLAAASVAAPLSEPAPRCVIRLTLAPGRHTQESVVFNVALSELIAYADKSGCTRLNLTRSRVVEVTETTAQIDLLARSAATQVNLIQQFE
ncbi:MAG TPA: hypothetical protein VN048_13660 [Verrucomicrobiae bacterium]|jgi:hypothetical protein|nr:hypothetical protein [Verrucomicrobiae bacterium]